MMAMKMDYELRGAKVAELPRDGTPVEVTVHDTNGSYYITDVKQKKRGTPSGSPSCGQVLPCCRG